MLCEVLRPTHPDALVEPEQFTKRVNLYWKVLKGMLPPEIVAEGPM